MRHEMEEHMKQVTEKHMKHKMEKSVSMKWRRRSQVCAGLGANPSQSHQVNVLVSCDSFQLEPDTLLVPVVQTFKRNVIIFYKFSGWSS